MRRCAIGTFDNSKKKKPDKDVSEIKPDTPARHQMGVAPGGWQVGDKILGRYEIHQILGGPGKSGMGIVYVCYDHEFKDVVALKTFQDKFLKDRAVTDRFKWEAETWVRLEKHYNIVQAKGYELIEERPFIHLEYVVGDNQYGVDLSGWILRGGLTLSLTLNFVIQFCHGMMHAEKKFKEMGKPFVHRDIKPSNILITKDKVVKITDFGLVRALNESDNDIISVASSDKSIQRLGFSKSGNICGTPPYMSPEQCRGEKDIDTRSDIYSFGCVLYEMVTGRPPFESNMLEGYIRHHLISVPEPPETDTELQKVIMKCLEKNPAKRYQIFSELDKALSEIYYRLTKDIVKVPEAASLDDRELVNKGASLDTLGFHDEAINCYVQALKINPNDAEAHNNLAIAYQAQGKLDEAIREYREALKINPNYAGAHYNLAVAYQAQGKLDEAIREYREALKINPNYANAHYNLGITYHAQGKLDEAIREYQEALKTDTNDTDTYYNLGSAYQDQGKLDEAVREYREALKINPNYAAAYYNLALTIEATGKHGDALELWKRYLVIARNNPDQREWIPKAQQHIKDLENKFP